jgi:hypothetical protein
MIPGRAAPSVAGAMYLHPHLATEHMRSTQHQRLAEGSASRTAAAAAMALRSRSSAPRRRGILSRRGPAPSAHGARQHV